VRRSPRTLGGAKGGSNGLASVRQTYTFEPKVSACARPLDLIRSLLGGGHTSVELAHLPLMAMTSSAATRPSGFFIWHEPSSAVARRVPQGALIAALIMSVLGQRATGREPSLNLNVALGAQSRGFS